MKKINLATTITLLFLTLFSFAQSELTYSLTRPTDGGNLQLIEFDLALGTQVIIKTYLPSELQDYNPEATAFDPINNRFITVGDFGSTDSLIAINVANGDIDHAFFITGYEIACIQQNGDKTYGIVYPLTAGNLSFVEYDLASGTENTIKTYLPSELSGNIPESTTFDNTNNRFITIGHTGGPDSLMAINAMNGEITDKYASPTLSYFGIEYNGGKIYALARPSMGGNVTLVEIDLVGQNETVIKTYLPAELEDFNPEATTFDHQNNRFIAVGAFGSSDSLIAINVNNGNMDYGYFPSEIEIFSIEADMESTTSVSESKNNMRLKVFPNPVVTEVTILSEMNIEEVKVINAFGQVVKIQKNNFSKINLERFEAGIYYIQVTTAHGVKVETIIKK